ncbi:MAG: thiamine phosphate synthase [Dehalococcoidia bacterium]|nr:thiamine phosphate synthase [Dehalococcoidia bacterium]
MRRLPQPSLTLVTDRSLCPGGSLAARVEAAVAGGVDLVQLREKELSAGELYRLALELKEAISGRAMLVVNDRLDVAIAAGVDGVQLPESGLPVGAARRLLRCGMVIGRSVHSADGAAKAEADGADFLVLGTIFPSRSHPGALGAGIDTIKETRARVRCPVLVIGGVDTGNLGPCISAGADGVAVISALLGAPDVAAAAREMKNALRQAWAKRALSVTTTVWESREQR